MRRIPFRATPDMVLAVAAVRQAGHTHGVIALPTETFYGLAVDPFDPIAVGRVFDLKGRSTEKALPIIAASLEQVDELVDYPGAWRDRLARWWPAPLTVVLPARVSLFGGLTNVAIRIPAKALLRDLLFRVGPLTATSANRSGEAAFADPDGVAHSLGAGLDLLLDGGQTPGGVPSTLIEICGDRVKCLRSGAFPEPSEGW
jgi:L-threonylcarbamoyladenylate synthase